MTEQNQNQNEKQKVLSGEQNALVVELTETYGIEPEEIMFFKNDVKPFLTYEATCTLINQLTGVQDITIEPMQSVLQDSLSLRCTLLTAAGYTRSAGGVANFNEAIDGVKMSEQQIYALASSRAIRNALKTAGIDLIKLHNRAKNGEDVLDFKTKSNAASLLAQAHKIGQQKGLIIGSDKSLWYHELWSRYRVGHSNELTEDQSADFVAFLNGYEPRATQAAA